MLIRFTEYERLHRLVPLAARSTTSLTPSRVSMFGSGFGSFSDFLGSLTALSLFSLVLMKPTREEGGSGKVFHLIEMIAESRLAGFHVLPYFLPSPTICVRGLMLSSA